MGLENCKFSLKMPQRMQDTLHGAVVEFRSTWNMGRGVFLKRLQKASVFSVMADVCTDITAVEEL